MRTRAGWLGLGLVLAAGSLAHAYFLDAGRNFDVRLRTYAQLGILTDSSTPDSPKYHAGDLAQERNFYNPEFDARLTDYTRWSTRTPGLSLLAPDDFKFRFAWWGFYDGLYDYLDPEWNRHREEYKTRFSESDDPRGESFKFNDENKNPRHIYARRNRINELYIDYTKGPVFVRAGRQAISWGESDTIALLDVQNPFDLTLGAPGFYQDVDEARIPLWTLRSTVKLVDNWKFLSSLFADAYVVPGVIDTTVPINPITAGVSPFNPDVKDPQAQVVGQVVPTKQGPSTLHIAVVDHLPENTWGNSRWGARLTGVLFRDYTVQGWFFRTFNEQPTPLLTSPGAVQLSSEGKLKPTLIDDRGFRVPVCDLSGGVIGRTPSGRPCSRALPIVTILERRLESVVGVAATWYNQPLNGIIRTEAEYFINELAFIPHQNLNARAEVPGTLGAGVENSIPKANYLRFVLGYDRFFFFRPLNPTNSIILSTAFNGQINMSERRGMDFRNPNQKPNGSLGSKPAAEIAKSGPGVPSFCKGVASLPPALQQLCVLTNDKNFEDAYPFEGFFTTAFQTDYMHGRLEPRLVFITDISGIFGFAPTATYRITDSFLATLTYLAIESSRKAGLGTFREHDMVQMRLTYQLN